MKEWKEHHYVFEQKEVIDGLKLDGETIIELIKSDLDTKIKITTK